MSSYLSCKPSSLGRTRGVVGNEGIVLVSCDREQDLLKALAPEAPPGEMISSIN